MGLQAVKLLCLGEDRPEVADRPAAEVEQNCRAHWGAARTAVALHVSRQPCLVIPSSRLALEACRRYPEPPTMPKGTPSISEGVVAVLQAQVELACAGSCSATTTTHSSLAMLELSCRCAHVMGQRVFTLRVLRSLRGRTIAALVRSA